MRSLRDRVLEGVGRAAAELGHADEMTCASCYCEIIACVTEPAPSTWLVLVVPPLGAPGAMPQRFCLPCMVKMAETFNLQLSQIPSADFLADEPETTE